MPPLIHTFLPGLPTAHPAFLLSEESMQPCLLIGGSHDSLNYPAHADAETIFLTVGVTGREEYIRSALSMGDVSLTVYLHKSLTPQQALNKLVESYKARAMNIPAGRL